jgi:hypothetical protein
VLDIERNRLSSEGFDYREPTRARMSGQRHKWKSVKRETAAKIDSYRTAALLGPRSRFEGVRNCDRYSSQAPVRSPFAIGYEHTAAVVSEPQHRQKDFVVKFSLVLERLQNTALSLVVSMDLPSGGVDESSRTSSFGKILDQLFLV